MLLPKESAHMLETGSPEEPQSLDSPLLGKTTLHHSDTNFLEEPQFMGSLLLEREMGFTSETNSLEGPHRVVTLQLGKYPFHIVEHTETSTEISSFLEGSIDQSSKILEQESLECHVLPACNESSMQLAQLTDITSGDPKILGILQENMLGRDYGCSSHLKETTLEDDCGDHSRSQSGLVCSPAKSPAHLEKLEPKSTKDDDDVYQNNIVSSGTIISGTDSHSISSTDAFISAQNDPSETHSSLAKPSLEIDMIGTSVDTDLVFAPLFTSNEGLQKGPVLHSVNYHREQSCHAHGFSVRNSMDGYVTPQLLSGARVLQTPKKSSTASTDKCLKCLEHEGTEQQMPCLHTAMETNVDSWTINDMHAQSSPPSAQQLRRSSGYGEKVASFKSDGQSQSTVSHQDVSIANGIQVQGNSYCKRVVMNCQSDPVLHDCSTTMTTSSLDCEACISDQLKTRDLSGKPQPSVRYSSSNSGCRECIPLNSEERRNTNNCKSLVAHSILSYDDASCIRKINSCFPYVDSYVKTAISEDKVTTQIDHIASGSGILNLKNNPSITSPAAFPSYALDQQSQQQDCGSNETVHDKSNPEFEDKSIDDDPEGQSLFDDAILWQNSNVYPECDETVQRRQNFGISTLSISPIIKERASEAFSDSRKLFDLSSSLSTKFKMHSLMEPLRGKYQSLSARFEELMNPSLVNSIDTKQHGPHYSINKLGVSGKCSLDLDRSFSMTSAVTYDLSNAGSVQDDREFPLTPSVEKYSLEKLSGRTRSNSNCIGSISELACYPIDEYMAEENENQENLPGCPGRNYSGQDLAGRKSREYVSSLYESREISSSFSAGNMDATRQEFTTQKTYSGDTGHHLRIKMYQGAKNPNENHDPSIRNKGKMTQPLHDRASRSGVLGSKNVRHRSEAHLEKGSKPSNIVTNMTSFIPLVKQKQRPSTVHVKKDVKVKALEAAEAAKGRQEKKQNERDMRKAAAELKIEMLKQERAQKQKQVEQKKKIDGDVVTSKRLRVDNERREKETKKKCTEEARKRQKQDDKEARNDLVGGEKNQFVAPEGNNPKAAISDGRSENFGVQMQENLTDGLDMTYEISPYKDSDEEDEDELEHQEERRRWKLIPSWAREENLDEILSSNQTLDPRETFARKSSFNLSDVLPVHIPQRRFN